jgi:hypothetical protein
MSEILVSQFKFSEKVTQITTFKNGQKGVFSPLLDLRTEIGMFSEIALVLQEYIGYCSIDSISCVPKKDNNIEGLFLVCELTQFSHLGKFKSKHEYFLPNEGYRKSKKELFGVDKELDKFAIFENIIDLYESASLEIENNLARYNELAASFLKSYEQLEMQLDSE